MLTSSCARMTYLWLRVDLHGFLFLYIVSFRYRKQILKISLSHLGIKEAHHLESRKYGLYFNFQKSKSVSNTNPSIVGNRKMWVGVHMCHVYFFASSIIITNSLSYIITHDFYYFILLLISTSLVQQQNLNYPIITW